MQARFEISISCLNQYEISVVNIQYLINKIYLYNNNNNNNYFFQFFKES